MPRLHRRSSTEYRAIASALVGDWPGLKTLDVPFSQARRTDVYSTWSGQASIEGYEVDNVWSAADAIATAWTERQEDTCGAGARTQECLRRVYGPVLTVLWSRTPTDLELGDLAASLDDAEQHLPPTLAVVSTMRELLMSPEFLFRSELGVDGTLQSHEVAAALTFTLLEAVPDERLLRTELTSEVAVAAEVSRVIGTPAQLPVLRRFLRELLQYENATRTFKDAATYPFHHPADLVDDTEQVVEQLVTQHARSGLQRALLTSDLIYVRPSTAQSWGVTPSPDAGVFLHDPSRTGVLTHPSWLVAMSEPDHNHLVRRGRFVQERLLCGEVPMLPGGVVPQIEKKPGLTFRQRVEQHSKDPACSGCHQLMDPLGVGFEAWDHLGRGQTMDNGGLVVTSGSLSGAGEGDGPYSDTGQLMHRLADSSVVRACWVKQLFRFVRGREVKSTDRCELERLTRVYEESGEDTLAVIEGLFASANFLTRTRVEP